MQTQQKLYEIKGNQFPFGVFTSSQKDQRKIYAKKRYVFKNDEEYDDLMIKITRLKSISHRNAINLRYIHEEQNSIDMIYQYVPHSLQDSFTENPTQTVKEIHRQFIELAIFLAKYCILTAFNPNRCGAIINEQTTTIKYYLPLNEITITNNRSMLERSVHLFNVQSMHYLDTLVTQCLNSTINQSCSQRTFKNRIKISPNKNQKDRRDSQPSGLYQSYTKNVSNGPGKEAQMRKLSTLSRQLSEISQYHKKRGASTRVSGGSFNTFKSIVSLKGHIDATIEKNENINLSNSQQTLKRCLSHNAVTYNPQLNYLIARSRKALDSLQNLREKMSMYKGFLSTLMKLKKQE